MAAMLQRFGSEIGPLDAGLPDFATQCDALIAARPSVASSIMGVFPPEVVVALKDAGIAWFATVTSVAEAREAASAGADALVVSGIEAGGHRGAFDPASAERQGGTFFALLPAIADAVSLPIVAAGGIGDGRGVAAALMLGASAVQIGTALLRAHEAETPQAWSDALARALPEDTVFTRAYSGRSARAIRNRWVEAAEGASLPYPLQRHAVAPLRARALREHGAATMQMWAGQAAGLARSAPAAGIVRSPWAQADGLLA